MTITARIDDTDVATAVLVLSGPGARPTAVTLEGRRARVDGALTGTMEVWLEPELDGTIVHYFLHAEPAGVAPEAVASLDLAAMNHARRVAGKVVTFETKRELEAGRPAGVST